MYCILLCLLLFTGIDVIDGAILSRPSNISQSPVGSMAAVHCTRDVRWTKPYQRQDCVSAVDLFHRHETAMYGESSVVFLAPRQADHGAVRTAETPRRYIVGKSEDGDDSPAGSTIADENVSTGGCVMAVLMLNTIEPGLVPGMERRAYLPMEISSVEELWFSANEIIRSCMRYGLGFGWREEGERKTTQLRTLMAYPPRNDRP